MENLTLDTLQLSFRTEKALKSCGIDDLQGLLKKSAGSLMKIQTFGKSSLKEIREKLSFYGLCLSGDILVRSPLGVSLAYDIPKLCEGLCESIREINGSINFLNESIRELQFKVKDMEETISRIISEESYKNDNN